MNTIRVIISALISAFYAMCTIDVSAETSDGYFLPVSHVHAIYPIEARKKRKQGQCIVRYTVDKKGHIKNPEILECNPPGYFEETSLEAIVQFKYPPRVVGGTAVEVKGVRARFWFVNPDVLTHSSHKSPSTYEERLERLTR
ncbi:MAG: energy transducer TonB [Pseudomonadales bacterium]